MQPVGDYQYDKNNLIGHGVFGIVYKGKVINDPSQTVAIKKINKDLLSTKAMIENEMKILMKLTKLKHENVVSLLSCMQSSKNVYIVMEYCNGGDLGKYLKDFGKLSEKTIKAFVQQLASALSAMNKVCVVHRDLKPQNILLTQLCANTPQSKICLKIADFGLARFLPLGTLASTQCGTPLYMAPEVLMSKKYDATADLWSLGVILFECLTGQRPFTARSQHDLAMFYKENPNASPTIPPDTSEELENLLSRLLKINFKQRVSFEQFLNHPFVIKHLVKCSCPECIPLISEDNPSTSIEEVSEIMLSSFSSKQLPGPSQDVKRPKSPHQKSEKIRIYKKNDKIQKKKTPKTNTDSPDLTRDSSSPPGSSGLFDNLKEVGGHIWRFVSNNIDVLPSPTSIISSTVPTSSPAPSNHTRPALTVYQGLVHQSPAFNPDFRPSIRLNGNTDTPLFPTMYGQTIHLNGNFGDPFS